MNFKKYKRNVVFCGFDEVDKNSMLLPDTSCYDEYTDESYNKRFPVCKYVKDLKEATKYQGHLVIIKEIKENSVIEFDKKYRKKLKGYSLINIVNNKKIKANKYARVTLIEEEIIYDSFALSEHLDYEYYKYYNNQKEIYRTTKRMNNIKELNKYLRNKKEVSTKQIANDLNISLKSIERYMKDLNDLYNNIGYDYTNNIWYIIK